MEEGSGNSMNIDDEDTYKKWKIRHCKYNKCTKRIKEITNGVLKKCLCNTGKRSNRVSGKRRKEGLKKHTYKCWCDKTDDSYAVNDFIFAERQTKNVSSSGVSTCILFHKAR